MAYPGANAQQLKARLDAGLAAHRQGDLDGALGAYGAVLAQSPDHPGALNLAGTALLQLGRTDEAVPLLERAHRALKADPHVLSNLGHAYLAQRRYPEACEAFRKASRIAPGEAQFAAGAAAALALQGKLGEARTLLERLSTRFPKAPLVWFNLGNVFREERAFEAALSAYDKALALDPSMLEARNSRGSALHSLLRFDEAEREYRACIAAAPEDLVARYNLASVTMDLGRFGEAEAVCREIVARAPGNPAAHRLLGTALGHQARLIEALASYRRAAEIAPDDAQTAQIYGAALMETGHFASGLRWLARAASLDPDSLPRKQVTSGALLAHGSLHEGWADYEVRPAGLELRSRYASLHPALSLPADLHGKRVCVIGEQGLGDQLFFLRYTAELKARGAHVTCRPARKIETLLGRASTIDCVIPESAELPPADIYVLAGDLPRALHDLPASALPQAGRCVHAGAHVGELARQIRIYWPAPAPTLRIAPLESRTREIAARLAELGPPPYLAVTWRGGTAPEKQKTEAWLLYKSIGIPLLGGVLGTCRGTIVALQRKPVPGELDALARASGRPVHDLSALNDDLEGMLALLARADEYIGVSNTNMHLRAAVGRSARVLVPMPAEWRWMQSGQASPWFPGFAIYRQTLQGDWSRAIEQLGRDLEVNLENAGSSNRP